MTHATSVGDLQIEDYLRRLDAALRGIAPQERQDILCEIRAHLVDSTAGRQDAAAAERALRLLGTPEELAHRYRAERMFTEAGNSFSPWLLLRTTWHWARIGIEGMLAFFLALVGYSTALGFTFTILAKISRSPHVGVWWGHDDLVIGSPASTEGMHELLGQWFAPVMVMAAFGLAAGTTQALRWLIRRRNSHPGNNPLP